MFFIIIFRFLLNSCLDFQISLSPSSDRIEEIDSLSESPSLKLASDTELSAEEPVKLEFIIQYSLHIQKLQKKYQKVPGVKIEIIVE